MGGAVRPQADRSLADRDLVVAFQSGDQSAYDEVYRRYAGRVRRICVRMLGNSGDADEAVQETFLKAYQALGRFNGSYQLGAWLARIAANVCVDHVRFRARSARMVSLDPDHETIRTEKGPEELLAGSDPRLETAIGSIQPLHAEALKLRALGGLSHEEMAGRLSMTPAQVKALLHRARTSFKRAWERAEALTLVPLVGLRSFLADRHDAHHGSHLLNSSTSFSPLLAERVAASAVIVAVALTGAPSAPSSVGRGAPLAYENRILAEQPVRPPVANRGAVAASEAAQTTHDRRGVTGSAIAALLRTDDAPLEARPSRRARRGAYGGGGITPAETKPVVRKARYTVDRAQASVRLPSR